MAPQISDCMIEEFPELSISEQHLEKRDLSNNRLDGELPPSLGLNLKLRTLNLSDNNLLGNIPLNISGNWTRLVSA
ncbi:hypothetical protein M758_UG195000 [Ceratodon purpureus]|nr:hypothetical protein M758_UG194900 [Ceratodon purpureus]KAG0595763.1 hypothetical protein M758_UG195000 [Ceratodon purpureus]